MKYVRLLTIAGSDSGGGAGIQADLKTFSSLGCYGLSVITALTAQNTVGVSGVHDVPAEFVAAQLDAVLSDIGADAVKIGMLRSSATIEAVADRLRHYGVGPVVLDPVMVSTSGVRLLQDDAVDALKRCLLPMVTVLTPNIPEAEVLSGARIDTDMAVERAAADLLNLGPEAVLIKGGHTAGPDSDDGLAHKTADGCAFEWVRGARIDTPNTHGTGCTLSSAIAAYLGRGRSVPDAVRAAKAYVEAALQAGAKYTLGAGPGPLGHVRADGRCSA